ALCVLANRVVVAGLVDADASQRAVLFSDHIAADPADLLWKLAVGDLLRALGYGLDLFGRAPGVLAANCVGVHRSPLCVWTWMTTSRIEASEPERIRDLASHSRRSARPRSDALGSVDGVVRARADVRRAGWP